MTERKTGFARDVVRAVSLSVAFLGASEVLGQAQTNDSQVPSGVNTEAAIKHSLPSEAKDLFQGKGLELGSNKVSLERLTGIDSEKLQDAGPSSVKAEHKWTGMVALEGVNKYFGEVVGADFQPGFAPRVMGSATRDLGKAGKVSFSVWNSSGQGNHQETDVGVGWSKDRANVDFSRYFVRGGDVNQFHGSVGVGDLKIKDERFPVRADVWAFSKAEKNSPPGGVVGKLTVSHQDKLRTKLLGALLLNESISLGGDSSPFGIGDDPVGMVFAKVEAIKKLSGNVELYGAWNASSPIAGAGNTQRRFRWNNWSWGIRKFFK